jgi:cytochrome P450
MAITQLLEGQEKAHQADQEISALLDMHIARRRACRDNDFISWLIHDAAAEAPLTDVEVREQAWLTILAGAGASTHWMANTMAELLTDRALRVSLEAGRLTVPQAMRRALWGTRRCKTSSGAGPSPIRNWGG